jgi:D-beta-D-heptose 7-phosphate kinase / D-beta-D-heptose 1-phosphate adenosyltransferase
MSERFTIHLDELSASILSDSPREQPYDRWVGNCVVANGCFDGLHPGHLSLLAHLDAYAYGERLRPLVAINSDESVRRLKGPARPVWPQEVRAKLINHLKWPLTVVIFDEDTPQRLMDLLKPVIVLKGAQYSKESVVRWRGNKWNPDGSQVVTVPMLEDWSTSKILGDTR